MGLDSKFYSMMCRRFRNSKNLSQVVLPPPLKYSVFSEREFQKEHQVEDGRIIDDSKTERIRIKESENQLPFNSKDFFPLFPPPFISLKSHSL